MKLHLPNSLRAALLACLSFAAPITQTVATGAIVGGALTYTILAQAQAEDADTVDSADLSYAGGTFTWTDASEFTSTDGVATAGVDDKITFSAETSATLGENITVGTVNIADNTTFNLYDGGTTVDGVYTDGYKLDADIDLGAGATMTLYATGAAAGTDTAVLQSGITIDAGADSTINMMGTSFDQNAPLQGVTLNTDGNFTIIAGDGGSIISDGETKSVITGSADSTFFIDGSAGNIYFSLDADVQHEGTLKGNNGRVYLVNISDYSFSNYLFTGGEITIGESNNGEDSKSKAATVTLANATIYDYHYHSFGGSDTNVEFATLAIGAGANQVSIRANSDYVFGTLTTQSGVTEAVAFTAYVEAGDTSLDPGSITINDIKDFNGTLTGTLAGDLTSGINVGNISSVGSGITTTLTGNITYTGESLSMFNEGTLSIENLAISANLSLDYTGTGTKATITALTTTNEALLSLDLTGVDLSAVTTTSGYNLQLGSSGVSKNSISLGDLTGYSISDIDGYWNIVLEEIGAKPGTIELVELNRYNLYSYEVTYEEDGETITATFAGTADDAIGSVINITDTTGVELKFDGEVMSDFIMTATRDTGGNNGTVFIRNDATTGQTSNTIQNLTANASDGVYNSVFMQKNDADTYTLTIKSLTGSGVFNLNLSNGIDKTSSSNYKLVIEQITNYAGSINNVDVDEYWHMYAGGIIEVSNVSVASGITTTIAGTLQTEGLTFTGTGTLTVTGTLTYTGSSLSMENKGTLSIASLVADNALTLVYGGADKTATIDLITGTGALTLDLSSGYADWDGKYMIELGILASGYESLATSQITGFNDSTLEFSIKTDDDGYYYLMTSSTVMPSTTTWSTADNIAAITTDFVTIVLADSISDSSKALAIGSADSALSTVLTSEEGENNTLTVGSLALNSSSLTIEDATLAVNGTDNSGTITLNDGGTLNLISTGTWGSLAVASTTINFNDGSSLLTNSSSISDSSTVTLDGTVTFNIATATDQYTDILVMFAAVNGEADSTLIKTGDLRATFIGSMAGFAGTIDIQQGIFTFENTANNTVNAKLIKVGQGASLTLQAAAAPTMAALQLDGGSTGYQDGSSTMTVTNLTTTGNGGTLGTYTNVTTLSSETGTSGGTLNAGDGLSTFGSISGYNGTVSGNYSVGAISVGSGITTALTGTTTYTGTSLSMKNEGTLTIESLALSADLTLDYSDSDGILAYIDSVTGGNLLLSFGDTILSSGFELGISSSLKDIVQLGDLAGYELNASGTYLTLSEIIDADITITTDVTWGGTGNSYDIMATDAESVAVTANATATIYDGATASTTVVYDDVTLALVQDGSATLATTFTLRDGAGLSIAGSVLADSTTISMAEGTTLTATGDATLNGAVTVTSNSNVVADADLALNNLSNSGTITKTGAGNLSVGNVQTEGTLDIDAGSLTLVSAGDYTGSIDMADGTSLAATNGATLATLSVAGTVTTTGSITLNSVVAATTSSLTGSFTAGDSFSKTGSGALSIDNLAASSLVMGVEGSLSIGSLSSTADLTLDYGSTVATVNITALSVGGTLSLDLDGLTLSGYEKNGYDLGIATGAYTLEESMLNITLEGYWTLDGTGDNWMLVFAPPSTALSYAGGTFTWNSTTTFTTSDGGSAAAGQYDSISFTADTEATLGEAITVGTVTIADGTTFGLSDGGFTLDAGIELGAGATLNFHASAGGVTPLVAGNTIDAGAGSIIDLGIDGSYMNVRLQGVTINTDGDFTINGNDGAAIEASADGTLSTITGSADSSFTITGDGSMYFTLDANIKHTGSLVNSTGGRLLLKSISDFAFSSYDFAATQVAFGESNNGEDSLSKGAQFTIAGASVYDLHPHAIGASNLSIEFATLAVGEGASSVNVRGSSDFLFGTLTTKDGTTTAGTLTAYIETAEGNITFNDIADFNGTLTGSLADGATGVVTVGTISSVGAGINTSITGSVIYGDTQLSMVNEGSLSIETLNATGDITLDYGTGAGNVATITTFGSDITSLILDLSGLTNDGLLQYSLTGEDFDLGVAGFTGTITKIDFSGLTDWTLNEETWVLTYSGGSGDLGTLVTWESTNTTLGVDLITDADTSVLFTSSGKPDVSVSGEIVAKDFLVISGNYTFSAANGGTDSMTVNELNISGGEVLLDLFTNATSVVIGSAGKLVNSTSLTAGSIDVQGILDHDHGYVNTDSLSVSGTGSIVSDDTFTVSGDVSMSDSASINSSSVFTVNGNMSMGDDSKVTIESSFTVNGALTMTGNASFITESYLKVDDGSSLINITGEGTLMVLKGATATAANIADTTRIDIEEGSTLKMTSDLSTTLLIGEGTLDMGSNTLNITAAMDSDTSVNAGTLAIGGEAVSLAKVSADTIVLQAYETLTVDSLGALNDALAIDISAIVNGDEDYFAQFDDGDSLTILSGTDIDTSGISFDSTSQGYLDSYAFAEGYKATFDVEGTDLVLNFVALEAGVYTAGDTYYKGEDGVVLGNIYQDADASAGIEGNTALTSTEVFDQATTFDLSKDQSLVINDATSADGSSTVKLTDVTGTGTLTLEGSSAAGGTEVSYAIGNNEGSASSFNGLFVKNAVASIVGTTSVEEATVTESATLSGELTLKSGAKATLLGAISNLAISATNAAVSLGSLELDKSSAQSYITASAVGSFSITGGSFSLGQQIKTSSTIAAIDGESISYANVPLVVGKTSSISGTAISLDVDSSSYDTTSSILVFSGAEVDIKNSTLVINDLSDDDRSLNDILGLTITISDNAASSFDSTNKLSFTGGLLGDASITWMSNDGKSYTATFAQDQFTQMAQSHNGMAGLNMVTDIVLTSPTGDVMKVIDCLNTYNVDGNYAAADKLAAAMAGASTTSIGSAAVSDIGRQLSSIRNRTRSMGVDPAVVNEDMPYINGWMAAEGSSNKLDSDGTAAGHSLNSVGGSIGFEVDLTEKFSMGVAYSYLLGDLSADGADTAEGDLNTMYGSVYARVNNKRWAHSFVASFGGVDAELERTVDCDGSPYQTKGDTSGTSIGLMYELGYTFALDKDATSCLQPVINLSYVNSNISGYTEKGGNGRLTVGEQKNSYFTLAAGSVYETIFGEDIYNRSSVFSARAMLKVDAGDRYSEADVSLTDFNGSTQTIKGAEVGNVGFELGVGLTVPVTEYTGAIFMDASCEFRSGMTNVNGTVGYRFSF